MAELFQKVIKHAKDIHCSESVLIELEEQKAFLGRSYLLRMEEWERSDFNNWYSCEWYNAPY